MSAGVLNVKLALLASSVDELRRLSMFEKAKQAEHCLALALDLLGELADRVETLEIEKADRKVDL